jgi:hypothetical protein
MVKGQRKDPMGSRDQSARRQQQPADKKRETAATRPHRALAARESTASAPTDSPTDAEDEVLNPAVELFVQ